MDADEQFGQPIVSNGLPLTKIHHAAFDAHLIGIDPNFCGGSGFLGSKGA
jgi:putative restriction endonuclease